MPLTFRTARPADIEAVVAMATLPHARGFLHPPNVAAIAEALGKPDDYAFVVERDDDVAGFVRLKHLDGWLVEIVPLLAREPGAGIGWFALREALRYAFETLHAHRISLDVVATNARARRLYENFGFVLEGTWRDGFRDDAGAYVDLCTYGLLDREYRPSESRESPRGR